MTHPGSETGALPAAPAASLESCQVQRELKGKDFLTLSDFSPEEIHWLLQHALDLKRMQQEGTPHPYLQGKVLGMIFEKPSTRTRVSFEVGMIQLGGQAIFLGKQDIQLSRGESMADTAKVLSRYVDGVMIRTFSHEGLEAFAQAATVPVINGLTDTHHPAQVMADLLTILEHKGRLQGLKLAYVGDGNNMAHSLLEGAVKVGMHIALATPQGYEPDPNIVEGAIQAAKATGSQVLITHDPLQAVHEADVVVTDVWASMGQEAEQAQRESVFQPYQVNTELCQHAKPDYIFLHCLPAHRGEEVTAEIIDGSHSVVFDEAENRLHAQKALLSALLG
ncbi:ornithine carbamoyltransferase [Caldalkalibacillus uzonensis]|uniref:Ornithine carbamoyltransferase n=1 Tax=Caldalkalibacillus uzonensis TaxID=353224 RepID=A0ABU0CW98_9BACI|nr:ornithine carbamoyltransferase [Caldalkalibacillus uzonensis]MDQ0340691.1 ornithine carbamoyltransferase [Caldalkalibacillus uzonensis]